MSYNNANFGDHDHKNISVNRYFRGFLLVLGLLVTCSYVHGQQNIVIQVTDTQEQPVESALVLHKPGNQSSLTSVTGHISIDVSGSLSDTFRIYALGYQRVEYILRINMARDTVQIILEPDPLQLDAVVVTGSYTEGAKFNTSSAITTQTGVQITRQAPSGTADILGTVPGVFADASAGDVFTRVYSRGISASAEDDIGWYYVSLQEDGLPVTSVHYTYFGPDFFFRNDLTVSKLEAVRGGISSIMAPNAPAGIFHFLSGSGGEKLQGRLALSVASQGDGNGMYRIDGLIGGPAFKNKWRYHVGGFYRYDEGPRNTDIIWGRGGQLKANLSRTWDKADIRFYAKYLDDQVNRYTGVAASNWNDPEPAFRQDFNTTALLLPKTEAPVPDARDGGVSILDFTTDKGIQTRELALGLQARMQLPKGWELRNALKYSKKSALWNTTIANQPLGLENFLAYFLSGYDNPWGEVVFRDARTQAEVARVNNLGALNAFAGLPPDFEYLNGALPFDAVMGIAPWQKDDELEEIMHQLVIAKDLGKHSIHVGSFFAFADVRPFTQASYAYATYAPEPVMLSVTLENPGGPPIQLSDDQGVANYAGLLYQNGDITATQLAVFLHDQFRISPELTLDGGMRYEYIRHNGDKDRYMPVDVEGGMDGDPATGYDQSSLVATGEVDEFDYSYRHLSTSVGANYRFTDAAALFARLTFGHKAPELNYYLNNFPNLPVDQEATTQRVIQGEVGGKVQSGGIHLFSTFFWSRLDRVPFSEFVFDQSGQGGLFFTPVQLNQTTTYGLELESVFLLSRAFEVNMHATLQQGSANKYTLYDAAGTTETEDDAIIDYSGNTLPHTPAVMLSVMPRYVKGSFDCFAKWNYMGRREGNISNGVELPGFHLFDMGMGFRVTEHVRFSGTIRNLFNGTGIMNFFGPNMFGSNANAATPEYVAGNPSDTFVVFPVPPRRIFLKAEFDF